MQLISQPTSPQTRSGTPVFVVGAGSATGDTSGKAPGRRFGHSLTTVCLQDLAQVVLTIKTSSCYFADPPGQS